MFEQLVESSVTRKKSRTLFYFVITAAVWLTGLSGALVFGVLAYDAALPEVRATTPIFLPLSSSPVGGGEKLPDKQSGTPPTGFVAPTKTPAWPPETATAPPTLFPVTDGNGSTIGSPNSSAGGGGGVPGGISEIGGPGTGSGDAAPRPVETRAEPVKPETADAVKPQIRRSAGPIQGTAIHKVLADYPRLAVTIRQTGRVVVEVVIDEYGKVVSARAVSGPAIFRRSAEEAARQWRWNPTRLGGLAVQVLGTITFDFTLDK
jgi:protein TonB